MRPYEIPFALVLAVASIGCPRGDTIAAASDTDAPTEYWMAPPLGLAMRLPAESKMHSTDTKVALQLPAHDFGVPTLAIEAARGATPASFTESRRLENGARIVFNSTLVQLRRRDTTRLVGRLSFEGEWQVTCVDLGRRDPAWCLPYLATLRAVEPKP